MVNNIISTIALTSLLGFGQLVNPFLGEQPLATHTISLENRYPVQSVSDIFRDNILLNLKYLNGDVKGAKDINWDEVKKPATIQFKLNPGETFAYHDDVLPEFKGKVVKTTQAHFNAAEGFKSDGYLFGDGVCHLASLMYLVAKDAGLDAYAPTNHDFMAIPEIDKKYGVAVYTNPYSKGSNAQQNLYITNNKDKAVTFKFEYKDNKLTETILEDN